MYMFQCQTDAMSSPEVEKFEITDEDLANEFFPKRRRQTKNQATYGKYITESHMSRNIFFCISRQHRLITGCPTCIMSLVFNLSEQKLSFFVITLALQGWQSTSQYEY